MTLSINSETTGGGNVVGSFVVTKPATVSDGDLLVVIIGAQVIPTITSPGWIQLGTGSSATGNDTYVGVFCRYVGEADDEPASYTFDVTVNGQMGWWIGSLTPSSQHANLDQAISFANRQNDTSPNTGALTTVAANTLAFAAWAVNTDSATDPPAGGWNTRADNVGGNGVLTVSSQAFPSAGTSTGTPEITNVAASQETETAMIVFRDGAAPANRATNIGVQVEYVADAEPTRLTNIGAQVEYVTSDDPTRLTNIGAQVEYSEKPYQRVTQEVFGIEYVDDQAFRVTAIGFQVEYIEIKGKPPKPPRPKGPQRLFSEGPDLNVSYPSIPHLRI